MVVTPKPNVTTTPNVTTQPTAKPSITFDCAYLSTGWIEDFEAKYSVLPEEAVQCDAVEGSAIVIKLGPSVNTVDIEAKMKEELLAIGRSKQSSYYEEICSTSGSFCITNPVLYNGKVNAVGLLEEKLILIVVNSEELGNIQTFLDAFWLKKDTIFQMLE